MAQKTGNHKEGIRSVGGIKAMLQSHATFRYAFAILASCLALLLRMLLTPVMGEYNPYHTVWLAVVFVAWTSGVGPSIVATLLGAFGVWFWLLPPVHSFTRHDQAQLFGMAGFLLFSLIIIALAYSNRRGGIAQSKLAAIVESSDDAIVSKNLNGIISSWNGSAERLFGYTANEAIGKHITLIIPPERRAEEDIIINKIRGGERVDHFETVRERKDGRKIHVSLTISPVRDSSGMIVGASKVARDITGRRQAEQTLRENQERLRKTEKLAAAGQLAASLAHEVNNPLSSVTNALFLLERQSGLNPTSRNLVGMAKTELARLSRIVKQSLSYYRMEEAPKDVDLGATLQQSLEVFSTKFDTAGIQISKTIVDRQYTTGFVDEIRQVIDNLLLNAIEAMPQGGKLKVSLHPSRDWKNRDRFGVRMIIADSGSGIPRELLSKVCQPFFTTKPEKGTGLGLWVVQGIIAKHDAMIQIRSSVRQRRSGTVFSIWWPTTNGMSESPKSYNQQSSRKEVGDCAFS